MQAYIAREMAGLNIMITDAKIRDMERLVIGFETRGSHPLALNTNTLGVHRSSFNAPDREALFRLFDVTEKEVAQAVARCPTVTLEHKVSSDAFNIMCYWLLHLGEVSIANEKVKHNFKMCVAKYMHYRFFTSLVNHFFTYGVKESVMIAAIDSLSEKFDIVKYKTWRFTIEARCQDLIGETSIHKKAIAKADDDRVAPGGIQYVITDTQSRMRDKIKNIADVYYTMHKAGAAGVTERSATMEIDGEKMLVQSKSTFDAITSNMAVEVLNLHAFIDNRAIAITAHQFRAVSPDKLSAALRRMSELASMQARSGDLDLVEKIEGDDGERIEVYVGMRILITNVVLASYRYCMLLGVSLDDKRILYQRIKDIYSASRISDPNIVKVKQSIKHFVRASNLSDRDATRASLQLSILLYLILRSFRYL